jgi:WD40 repeat protein
VVLPLVALIALAGCINTINTITDPVYKPIETIITRPVRTLNVGRGAALAFSPSGEFIATSGDKLQIWRVHDGASAGDALDCPGKLLSLAFSPDARYLAGTLDEGRDTKRVLVWALQVDRRPIAARLVFPAGRSITNGPIAFSKDGDMVALVSSSSVRATTVVGWTRNGDTLEHALAPHPTTERPKNIHYFEPCIFRGDFSRDGSVVAIGRQDKDGALELFCSDSGDRLVTFEKAARASAFAISNDVVAGAIAPNVVRLWSRQSGELVADLEGRWDAKDDTLWSLAFSPAGGLLAGAGLNGRIHVWSVNEKDRVMEIRAHEGVICAHAFSPKGGLLASAGFDGLVKFWEVEAEEPSKPGGQ